MILDIVVSRTCIDNSVSGFRVVAVRMIRILAGAGRRV